jgi:oxaloacetate decarboxylase alpha subunit
MLTNLESQLREQNAQDRLDDVLAEIPKVREELGFIPLVTPTSQIVGTQAVINVLTGERYKSVTKETAGVLAGEYGATPAPLDAGLQERVLDGAEPITCRPADLLAAEMESLTVELAALAAEQNFALADEAVDDVLTYALFPQVGLKFLQNRGDASAFELAPSADTPVIGQQQPAPEGAAVANYSVAVDGKVYQVQVAAGETHIQPVQAPVASAQSSSTMPLQAGLAGTVNRVLVAPGEQVVAGQTVMILEAMKMETEVSSVAAGTVAEVLVRQGDAVIVGQNLLTIAEV